LPQMLKSRGMVSMVLSTGLPTKMRDAETALEDSISTLLPLAPGCNRILRRPSIDSGIGFGHLLLQVRWQGIAIDKVGEEMVHVAVALHHFVDSPQGIPKLQRLFLG